MANFPADNLLPLLAATIRHDGQGGVADLLESPADAAAWLDQHHDLITQVLGRPLRGVDDAHDELVQIRSAVRALFARAVAPGPPSKADADRLMDGEAALRMVNRVSARVVRGKSGALLARPSTRRGS